MSKQRILDVIQTAQRRAVAIQPTVPGFDFNEALSMEGYRARIDAARDAVFQYIALQSRLNAQRSAMLAARRALAEWSHRMLCAIHSTYGMDSQEYQVIAAATSQAPRRRPRKRIGTAVATGGRATGSKPRRSTAHGTVEDDAPVALAGLVGARLVTVGREEDAGTEPQGHVATETVAVRRIEAVAPRERHEDDARPADAMERVEEINGAEEVAEDDVEAPNTKPPAIDASDAERAFADALVVPRSVHQDVLEEENGEEADSKPCHAHVADDADADAEGEQDGKEGGKTHGDCDVHPFGGSADNGCGPGQGERDGTEGANSPVGHERGGAPRRGCAVEWARRLDPRRKAVRAVPWTVP